MWDLATIVTRNEQASRLWSEGQSIRPAQVAKKKEANLSDQRVSALKAELTESDLAILEERARLS